VPNFFCAKKFQSQNVTREKIKDVQITLEKKIAGKLLMNLTPYVPER